MNMLPLTLPLAALSETPAGLLSGPIDIFNKGGVVMWPLLLCSLVAATVAIERLLYFWRDRRATTAAGNTAEQLIDLAAAGQFAAAEELGRSTHCAAGRVLAEGLKHRAYGLHDTLETAADVEIDRLRHGLSVLDTIITLAPMLGILGTVTGIIRSFHLLGVSGVENPTAVTGGIAEALITTAAGLVIAIGTLVPFNYCVSQVKRRARLLEQIMHRFEMACERGRQHGT
jgi:biopolymer transport protein ExbB